MTTICMDCQHLREFFAGGKFDYYCIHPQAQARYEKIQDLVTGEFKLIDPDDNGRTVPEFPQRPLARTINDGSCRYFEVEEKLSGIVA